MKTGVENFLAGTLLVLSIPLFLFSSSILYDKESLWLPVMLFFVEFFIYSEYYEIFDTQKLQLRKITVGLLSIIDIKIITMWIFSDHAKFFTINMSVKSLLFILVNLTLVTAGLFISKIIHKK